MRRRVTILGLLQAAAVLTMAFAWLTLLPVDHFALQLFTHFRLQYFVIALLLFIVFAAWRKPLFAGALLVTAAVCGSLILPLYSDKPTQPESMPAKFLLANVHSGNGEHEHLFELIDAEKPDIIILQEVSPEWEAALSRLNETYPYSLIKARSGNFGIALFSNLPMSSIDAIDSPPFGYPTIVTKLVINGKSLRIIASHPTIPVRESLYAARNEQLESLADLAAQSLSSTVLVGDLNLSPWDVNYRSLLEKSGLTSARRGFGTIPTWPTIMPFAMIPIDHVLISSDIGVVEMRSGPRIGSDHLPIIVTLAL